MKMNTNLTEVMELIKATQKHSNSQPGWRDANVYQLFVNIGI